MRRRICILKGCDVVLDFLVDLLLGRAGEALSLAFALLRHIPDHSAPATVGALKYISVR